MNTIEARVTLRYDDQGNVVSYELSAPVSGEPETISITSIDDPPSPFYKATDTVIRRLIGAINTEFDLPPIPGMQR